MIGVLGVHCHRRTRPGLVYIFLIVTAGHCVDPLSRNSVFIPGSGVCQTQSECRNAPAVLQLCRGVHRSTRPPSNPPTVTSFGLALKGLAPLCF